MSDALTPEVAALVRLSARIAIGSEFEIRAGCAEVVAAEVPTPWVEECILQSYLMAGFPRTLNAMREWRRVSGVEAPEPEEIPEPSLWRWRQQGEQTCEIVYGKFYTKLRENIAHLHPALDEWTIVEGYGKDPLAPGLRAQATRALHRRRLRRDGAGPATALASARRGERGGDRRGGRGDARGD